MTDLLVLDRWLTALSFVTLTVAAVRGFADWLERR